MKKLIILIMAVSIGFSANAQDIDAGLKAGVNFAQLSGNATNGLDGRTGFHVGGIISFELIDYLAIQGEVVYSQQGFTQTTEAGEEKGLLDYINVPVLVDFNLTEGFSLQGGPQIGFHVTKTLEQANGEEPELNAESIDFSVAAGAQYRAPLGILVQIRYAIGLTDVITDFDTHNSVFSLSVGWMVD